MQTVRMENLPIQQFVNWFDRLDLHMIMEILMYLDCKSLSKIHQVNTSLCILGRMLSKRVPHWKTAHFEKKDEQTRSKISIEDYDAELNNIYTNTTSVSNVGFLFSETNAFEKKVVDALASKLHPTCCLIGGCNSAILSVDNVSGISSLICETDHAESMMPKFSLSLANMPDTVRVGFYLDTTDVHEVEDIPIALESIPIYQPLSSSDEERGEWKVIILFVDQSGCSHHVDQLITAIQQKFSNAQVVGGIMGGTRNSLCIIQNQKAEIFNGGIVGMCIGGNTVFSSQVSRGCQEISPIASIVDADEYIVRTINLDGVKQNAVSLANCLGDAMVPFLGVSNDLTIGFSLHDVRGVTADGALVSSSNEIGSAKYMQFFNLDPNTSKVDLKHRLEAAKKSCAFQSKQVLGGLLFTCGGRGVNFYEEHDVESRIFAQTMPGIGLSGFFAGGEIGPEALAAAPAESDYRRDARLQGFTAVFGIFFVPKYCRPSGKIIDEAIAARNLFF